MVSTSVARSKEAAQARIGLGEGTGPNRQTPTVQLPGRREGRPGRRHGAGVGIDADDPHQRRFRHQMAQQGAVAAAEIEHRGGPAGTHHPQHRLQPLFMLKCGQCDPRPIPQVGRRL